MHFFCWVVQCKSTTKSMKMCLEVLKVERKNRTEVHVYAHDQCQANLSMGWLVCACIAIFHEVITIFFLAVLCWPNTFWSTYPSTVGCTQMLRNAILQKKKKKKKNIAISIRTSTTAAMVVILGKTPVSLPITTGYLLPPTWDRFQQKKKAVEFGMTAKLHDLALDPIHSWSTAADSCPPSDFSDRPPISISMTTGRKWLTWNRSILDWSHLLTSDLKRCLLFRKCLHWSSLKAVSVPSSFIGGLRGSKRPAILYHDACVMHTPPIGQVWHSRPVASRKRGKAYDNYSNTKETIGNRKGDCAWSCCLEVFRPCLDF